MTAVVVPTLDVEKVPEAWRSVEDALPDGWDIEGVVQGDEDSPEPWTATAGLAREWIPFVEAHGVSPAEALDRLAACLRDPDRPGCRRILR